MDYEVLVEAEEGATQPAVHEAAADAQPEADQTAEGLAATNYKCH